VVVFAHLKKNKFVLYWAKPDQDHFSRITCYKMSITNGMSYLSIDGTLNFTRTYESDFFSDFDEFDKLNIPFTLNKSGEEEQLLINKNDPNLKRYINREEATMFKSAIPPREFFPEELLFSRELEMFFAQP
jgi:hypothetical protein